ncbi:helix-turn-helix domain-containing protein [Methylocystis sp. MJC1]|uniref:helix-turn-helix domain-containing protein n=1 Tax=Methylocystis sp. MJC1 TaxID=2654282 RepID=UPI0013EBE657|nr:helix-turn-helix domain-containing protein [Methylocystis sp. MJC1]KAF2990150.1 hypothetical protein MJC1_02810 [Methylocystis sp. MJC1]MBU6527599.1 helix-turn-helix domain-containing protein [Methylocystis sp. MJC1]UZX10538.1 helix-turn-helix domain-containing protein [Methylocystis sp. MJC1]
MNQDRAGIPPAQKIALRINEAAAMASLSRSTLYQLLKAGKLATVKVGGRRLVLRESLEALLRTGA